MKSHVLGFALLSVIAIVTSAPAHAQNGSLTRSFVSSAGLDTNACTITAPCASFATAYTKIAANGIIAALDPGKYGPIAITGPVTINGNGWAAITAPASGTGITINAGSGNVILTGLEIDGAGTGYDGILFNSGSSLTVTNCILQNFFYTGSSPATGNGILMQPISGAITFAITNSTFSNNGYVGLYYFPSSGTAAADGIIDHVVATNNQYGIAINTTSGGGSTKVAISNSIASDNSADGIYVQNEAATLAVSLDNSSMNNNDQYGISANATSTVILGRSVITANNVDGVFNATSPSTVYSYQDNRINGNGANSNNDVTGLPMNSYTLK
jgi:hypothetical protein